MADNVVAGAAVGTGPTFAADDIGGVYHPRAKVEFGVDGSAVDVSASNPLPVVQTGTPGLPTGAATAAKQDTGNTSLATLAGAVAGTEMQVDVLTMPVVAVNDNGASLTVDGTVTANAGTGTFAVSAAALPLPSGASTEATLAAMSAKLPAALDGSGNFKVAIQSGGSGGTQYAEDAVHASGDLGTMGLMVRKDTAAALAGADGDYAPGEVDASGRLWVNGSSVTQPVSDAGGSLTTDTPQLPAALVSGRLDTVIGAALPAGTNNIGDVDVLSLPALAAGTNNIGDVDVLTVPADPFGVNADAASATGSISAKLRFIAGTGIPITGTVTVGSHAVTNAGTFAVQAGQAAHDAAIAGNPVRAGGRARTSDIASVVNDDTADFITDLNGKQITLPYSIPENMVSGAITSAMTGTTSTSLVAAPAAGLRNYITTLIVSNSHATVGTDVVIQDGNGGTTLMTIPAGAIYGGAVISLPVPLRQPTTATAIYCANVTTGASTKVSAVGYKAP